MQRRGGPRQPAKGQRTLKPKARKAPTAEASAADLQEQVAALTRELKEAREQQAVTADVLKGISRSTFDLQTVLDTLAESAVQLCEAYDALIFLREGKKSLRVTAHHGAIPTYITPIGRGFVSGRAFIDRTPIHIHDLQASTHEFPDGSKAAVRFGYRTILAVPLLRQDKAIGVLTIRRTEVKPFTDKQIELVQNFAAQAVIAIENTRLLNELRESLQQQTATADVLKVISSSPGNLEPVFHSILENVTQICEARFGTLNFYENNAFRTVALHNPPPQFAMRLGQVIHPHPESGLAHVARTKQIAHIEDIRTRKPYLEGNQAVVELADLAGARTLLIVPMLKEGELVGAISIYRQEVRPFTDKQIELVKNFAAQAVIAIENTRLLNELRERTDQLEARSQEIVKLNRQLEQRVTDQVGEIERMSRLRRFLPPQVADLIIASGTEKQLESHRREITALFCDLRGFTGFSESADPEDVMSLLRGYHATIGEIIIKYSGTLEHYAGDGVMVFFNDPIPVPNPALQAVQAALDMRTAIGSLTEKWRRLGHELGFGVGIAHGFATLGTIGFEGRFDYAAVGTVSNVASRLCDEAKPGQILISPRVLVAVEDAVTAEPVGDFTLKGISRPVAAYNVVSAVSSKFNP
jgi:adenylate cyclase